MTEARPWPNNASRARDEAVYRARHGLNALQPVLDGEPMTNLELLRRVAYVLTDLHTIETLLVGAGAPERNA